jgi:hypothetical protein
MSTPGDAAPPARRGAVLPRFRRVCTLARPHRSRSYR